jgi:hypothetical protein
MKLTWIFVLITFNIPTIIFAQDYSFSWLPNQEYVNHYEICYGTTPEEADNVTTCIDVGNEQLNDRVIGTLYDFPDNTLYFLL